ncbi:sodium/potassium-transporting ATPase subunit beta-2 isoform X1 [Drosophila hydei]|uniref:Sodium/potassium-transporting ATPase subunit beta-2 isoform X1 n=1 Tax=Drosophila hydei TaxID=7224 RepID=A0A6J1M077_DROHY|nr:sodium/potassium-transporting ATPase subunit beta-2 isoform X1 [Drosophila hydei]XP_023172303.1 sodium/potassium-transporting ATPase subunit beta-2 isoform X1 [Drosophila hydei]XP_023172304.1 sodium/potassium-transporting ATPase subunit beta-2 isoform X1 [Drosophila hydei]XP_023172306.1 sodium/potassium-transporting ATPase subunit beta-2 isoform X1 [Drosophila hydei]
MADKKIGEYYAPPPKMGKWEGFKKFIWNSETSQCLGRTGSSWAKILLFYIIFYAALTGFFAAIFAVFYQTLEVDKPKWMLDNGLIGSNPGLGFRPMPPEANVESTLVWYESSKKDNYMYWVEETERFLKYHTYDELPKKNQVNCSFEHPPPEGKVCGVEVSSFAPCTFDNNFGYHLARPCIFLKLNKIYNWEPQIYDLANLPKDMPEGLKHHIKEKQSLRPNETAVVWVSCEGENPADVENIKSRDYYPRMGFPSFYFPFKNIEGYIPPIVAVQFTVETGVLINIECKAWARNIKHDRSDRRGSVHFELMVD